MAGPAMQLSALKGLSLAGCSITDRGLTHLEGLLELEYLSVRRTGVTDEGLAALKRNLPKLEP